MSGLIDLSSFFVETGLSISDRRNRVKITFQNQKNIETEHLNPARRESVRDKVPVDRRSAASAVYSNGNRSVGVDAGKGKSVLQLQQEAAGVDVGIQQDYMTLMSNTMSEEDYARLQEEGFDFGSMDPEETVTIVDKIKAELVRSGKRIAGYTDDIDMETLAAALGSQALAQTVAESFREADLPLTEENISAVAQAWTMANQLEAPGQGSIRYLLDNGLDNELWNLYMAENSGAAAGSAEAPAYYAEDIKGYYTRTGGSSADGELAAQIDNIIARSGRQPDEESRQDASWLLDNGLPLTEENLEQLKQLKELEFPVTMEAFAKAAATAVEQGKSPLRAEFPGETEGLYEKAVRWDEYYHSEQAWEACEGNLTARRQLEEIRLHMTAEANVKLLKSGFSIDTAPMEKLISALRQAEKELAEQYFPQESDAVGKYHEYKAAETAVRELPGLPAGVIGSFAEGQSIETLGDFHTEGKALQDTYKKAGESYETLMTAPRRDLGDSIRKAFANVDDILSDLGQELTEENRRAVRILGYNRMEMNLENLDKVREADRQVQTVVEKLTPAATLKMIRDGVNPLEKSFAELEKYFAELPEEYQSTAENYSRFLYGLERNHEITDAERESYIGIYRLVRQIEKTDGAAVGALVNAQAEVHFSNLLSAVRSGKAKSLDTKVGDRLGAVAEIIRSGESIPTQISKAFSEMAETVLADVSYSETAEAEYSREQLAQYRSALASADAECTAMLQRGELPAGADNLIAAMALLEDEEELFDGNTADADSVELWTQLDRPEEFEESYAEALADRQAAVEEATFGSADSSLDVRHMQLCHKQLTIAGRLAQKQEFFLPLEIDGKMTRVHLCFEHNSDGNSQVEITVRSGGQAGLSAELGFKDGKLDGILKNNGQEVMKTERIADIFRQEAGESWTVGNVSVVTTDVRAAAGGGMDAGTENRELYRVAKVFLHAVQQGEMTDEN